MTELRGALIGCGFFADNHLHAWQEIEGARIVALCDRDPVRLGRSGERFDIGSRYLDAAQMLEIERPDFVDIATTVPSHRALVELAAMHGLPVICQKPFASSMADARAMTTACEAAGVPLMVHENFRWQTPLQRVRGLIDDGAIGQPFFGRFSFRSAFDVFSGQPYLAEGERFIIEDLGIHILDIARFVLGDVDRLTARTHRINPSIRGEDVATMLLGHGPGVTSIVDCSYTTRLAADPFPETLVEIDGSAGTIRLEQGYQLTLATKRDQKVLDVSPPMLQWATKPWHNIQESVRNIQSHFIDCLHAGREPQTSGRDNLKTLQLVEAAYESARTGTTLDPREL